MKNALPRGMVLACVVIVWAALAHSQTFTVTGTVVNRGAKAESGESDVANVAVWLVPTDKDSQTAPPAPVTARMTQKNKSFEPRLLVLPAGSSVEFPNKDPFFHNVFSLFNGKRFDLGLYEAGDSRAVHFDRVGVSYIFCNIHPEMSAVIVTVGTPYYGISDRKGAISIKNVPEGDYEMHIFTEGLSADAQHSLVRTVSVSAAKPTLGTLQIPERRAKGHKNKYGRDYDTSTGEPYQH